MDIRKLVKSYKVLAQHIILNYNCPYQMKNCKRVVIMAHYNGTHIAHSPQLKSTHWLLIRKKKMLNYTIRQWFSHQHQHLQYSTVFKTHKKNGRLLYYYCIFIYFTFLKQFVTVYNSSTLRISWIISMTCTVWQKNKETNTVMNPKGI